MRFHILGPLEVWDDGHRLAVGGPQQRAVLALLLVQANRVVSTDRLVDQLWGDDPPPTARSLVQGCIAGLRRALRVGRDETLLTRPPGYLLRVRPGELDLDRFEELADAADRSIAAADRAAPERTAPEQTAPEQTAPEQTAPERTASERAALERAAALLSEALSLWRGPALDDIALDACRAEAARLEERRLAALEARIDVDLRLERHQSLIAELRVLVLDHPLRERLWAQLMIALHRADRRADALEAYRQVRQTLVDELGVEPGATLRRLQREILAGARGTDEPGSPAASTAEAPVGSAAGIPAQLPAAVAAFTGRDQHLKRLDELLGDLPDQAGGKPPGSVTIAVICGTAGVGKTALAVHWAHQVRDQFGGGQLYVNLRGHAPVPPMRPIEALAGFLHALGVPAEKVPVEPDGAAALFRTLVADRRVLVVLDNARSAEQVRPLLPASPRCMVLVTSRDRLGGLVARDGAVHHVLDVLTPDEAHTLLGRLLGRRVRDERQAAERLARSCALLPLALRIAAANLLLHPGRGIAEQVAELAAGNRLGAMEVDGDELSAIRATFDLSYHAVEPDARRLFRLLGLVPGPDVTADAAAALAATTPDQAAQVLDRLARAHLVERDPSGRYTFHDLLRVYAAERAHRDDDEPDRRAATRRLLDWYLRTVDAAARLLYPEKVRLPARPAEGGAATTFDDDTRALAWLDAELPNLSAATRYAADHGPHAAAWLLADALRGYFQGRIPVVAWLEVARAGLDAARADGDLDAQAAVELSLGDLYRLQGTYPAAIDHFTRAASLAGEAGWGEGQSGALGNLGIVYQWSGRPHEAAAHYARALAIDRQIGRIGGQAINLGNLCNVYLELGRLTEAAHHLAESVELSRRLGFRGSEGTSLAILGDACRRLGRFDEAIDHVTRAVAMLRDVGDRGAEAESIGILAKVHTDAGRLTEALTLAEAAVGQARETGNPRFTANTLNMLATVHQRLGRYAQALDLHEQALTLSQKTETLQIEMDARIGLATAHWRLGHHDQALAFAHVAVAVAREDGLPLDEGDALAALAGIHLDLDQPDTAREYARRALAIFDGAGDRLSQARALLVLGRADRRGGITTAVGHWRRALAILTALGVPEAGDARALLAKR